MTYMKDTVTSLEKVHSVGGEDDHSPRPSLLSGGRPLIIPLSETYQLYSEDEYVKPEIHTHTHIHCILCVIHRCQCNNIYSVVGTTGRNLLVPDNIRGRRVSGEK